MYCKMSLCSRIYAIFLKLPVGYQRIKEIFAVGYLHSNLMYHAAEQIVYAVDCIKFYSILFY